MPMPNQLMTVVMTALAGIALTLYIMRRRTRLGRRTPKF